MYAQMWPWPLTQNFNMYKRLIDETIAARDTMNGDSYKTWASLRDMLLSLVGTVHNHALVVSLHFCAIAGVEAAFRERRLVGLALLGGVRSLSLHQPLVRVAFGPSGVSRGGCRLSPLRHQDLSQPPTAHRLDSGRQGVLRGGRRLSGIHLRTYLVCAFVFHCCREREETTVAC